MTNDQIQNPNESRKITNQEKYVCIGLNLNDSLGFGVWDLGFFCKRTLL